ncbi:hypothetical protein N7488_007677 [Penicillium malachiteum]|nr:hypothetical protein N7488_007677 [Penicillium malachiteum]
MSPRVSTNLILSPGRPLKSKLGCKTCKIRRVKCGEEKPSCLRCTQTGRKCDYGSNKSSADLILSRALASPLSSTPNTISRERRAFAYYFQCAATSVGGGLDVDFWLHIVPQVCRRQPAVWDAMICISALCETPDSNHDPTSLQRVSRSFSQNRKDALDWYSRSVSGVRQGIERGNVDAFVGLITCVLFICIESLLGSIEEVMRLYAQGVQLIATLREQKAYDKLTLLRETVIPIFVRLGIFSPQASWSSAMSLLSETPYGERVPFSKPGFPSLKAARDAIVILAAEIPMLENECESYLQSSHAWYISEDLVDRQRSLSARLADWQISFANLMKSEQNTKESLSPTQISMSALLLTYHEMLFVILSVCVSPVRVSTDAYTQNFRTIVEQASIALNNSVQNNGALSPYTFEISVGLPLWFTCLRCREPIIRRAALSLLASSHRIQGLSKREHGITLVEKIMELEEAHFLSTSPSNRTPNTTEGIATPINEQPWPYHSDMSSPSSPFKALNIKAPSIPSPPLTDVDQESATQFSGFIPQEARIRPHGIFRPRDGYPPGKTRDDFAHWGRGDDQFYMEFSWNECDESDQTWRTVFGYVPIDIMP